MARTRRRSARGAPRAARSEGTGFRSIAMQARRATNDDGKRSNETGASADYTLYGDTLGPKGSPGATYLTMEQANADAMVRGFTAGKRGCTIPGI